MSLLVRGREGGGHCMRYVKLKENTIQYVEAKEDIVLCGRKEPLCDDMVW